MDNNMSLFAKALNESQLKAVCYVDGPQLVIAGAGSGKTRVLTYKIAWLLQQGMQPWNILALTFTNKAANEMKARIGELVGAERALKLQMGTFHSLFARILRAEASVIGFESNFTIYDEADSRSLIKSIVKEMQLDEKVYKPATVHKRIGMAKNQLIDSEHYLNDPRTQDKDTYAGVPEVGNIFARYEQRCRKANAMDFDDLLVQTFKLFSEHEEVRKKYATRFQYILVDEYQDTNHAQQQIVSLLTRENHHVCVVGDDAQSIYAFRGANIDNILNFQRIYPDCKLFKLEQNYRSTQNIVKVANSLIRHNERQIPKEVFSKNAVGEKIKLKPTYSDKEEAVVVCKEILKLKSKEGSEFSDFAILYRTNAQSRSFEEEMRRQHIPYRIFGGMSFYQRKEIKDVIAYFRLVANPDDEEAFKRIINYPARAIGNTTVARIGEAARKNGVSLWTVIGHPADYQLKVNSGTMKKLEGFRTMIEDFIRKAAVDDVYTLGTTIIKQSGISADIFSGTSPDDVSRQENLNELLTAMQDFVESNRETDNEDHVFLTDFLQEVSLMSDLDSDDDSDSKVNLMTVHAAKGLEFPTVFVVGLEENIFPSAMSVDSDRMLEEERRLLYVAITRAEKHCYLTYAKHRMRYGTVTENGPSRFLGDIDGTLVDADDDMPFGAYRKSGRNGSAHEYEPNRPYMGSSDWGNGARFNPRMQNSRPVASQFMADVKPKVTGPRQPETAVNPLSDSFKQQLLRNGGRLVKINKAITNGGRTLQHTGSGDSQLKEGTVIEHQRFGIGTVEHVEGTGENATAQVNFKNAGVKKLLLKFARYKIIG